MSSLLLLVLAALFVTGCTGEVTEVVVIVDGGDRVVAETAALVVTVGGADDYSQPFREVFARRLTDVAWPVRFTLAPRDGDAARVFRVRAEALGAADAFLVSGELVSGYVSGASITIRLTLEDGCVGVICGDGLTCRGGGCVPSHPVVGSPCDGPSITCGADGAGECVSGVCVRIIDPPPGSNLRASLGPDADGDGGGDIAAANTSGLYLYSGTGAMLRSWPTPHGYVALGPDADGDGLGDVLATSETEVLLYSSANGSVIQRWPDGSSATAISLGPDADGDDRGDVLVGLPFESPGGLQRAGRVVLYSGATGAVIRAWDGPTAEGMFGASLSLGPDTDGDGRADVFVGAPGCCGLAVGRAFLFSGATGTEIASWDELDPNEGFGEKVSLGPDVDGDGRGDAVIGAPTARPGGRTDAGRVDFYSSAAAMLTRSWLEGARGARLTINAAALGPDADGDGWGDVLVASNETHLHSGRTGALLRMLPGGYWTTAMLGPDIDGDDLGDVVAAGGDIRVFGTAP